MENKLQELTEKLYNEGLSRGKAEGEQILAESRAQAEQILAAAKKEAEQIKSAAQQGADDLRAKVESDLKMAAQQSLQATKKDIENLCTGKITSEKVSAALADSAFVKELIKSVAGGFSSEKELSLVLPESLKSELEPWVGTELQKAIGKGVSAQFSKKVGGGFSIGPKDGGWFVDLSEESFRALIAEYLRPVTRKLLFGE